MSSALVSATLAVVAAAAFIVPLPWVELAPGPAVDVPPRIRMGHPTHPVNGRLLLLTVDLSQPSAAGALQALAGSHRELVPISEVIPPGTDPGRYERAEREDADLIVVGDDHGLADRILGGVAHHLPHHTRRPVVIVPASSEPGP